MQVQTHFDPADIEKNKVMGIISYLGFLCLIPIFTAAKESQWAKFHANQGLSLFAISVGTWLASLILSRIPIIALLFWIFSSFIYLGILILAIIGLINAIKGEAKPLPLVGNMNLIQHLVK